MFNDHLIFSNNIHDAANKLRQIQEANIRSAADLQLLGRDAGEAAGSKAAIAAIGQGLKNSEVDAIRDAAHMKERSGYARRAGIRSYGIQKLHDIIPHLARSGDNETLEAVARVLNDINQPLGVEDKRAGAKDYRDAEYLNKRFAEGGMVTPPASTADLKLAASIMRGKYQVPWQEQPKESDYHQHNLGNLNALSPDASDGPDIGADGDTEEVQVDAEERSSGTDPRARAIRQQQPMRPSTGPTAQDIAAVRFGVGRTRKF